MMTSVISADRLPADLAAALEEIKRRAAVCAAAGQTHSDAPPLTVVVDNAPEDLQNPDVRAAVEWIARLGRKTNISVELRGAPGYPTSLEDVGGSEILRMLCHTLPTVYWQCVRPLLTYPGHYLEPGVTRLVHADRRLREVGRADTGVFIDWHVDRSWVRVQFPDQAGVSTMLASEMRVEVTPRPEARSGRFRPAPPTWISGTTQVRYLADDRSGLFGRVGTFLGDAGADDPTPTGRDWTGVLVDFADDVTDAPLEVDPADLELVPDVDA